MIFSPVHYREEKLVASCELLSLFTDDDVELEGVLCSPENISSTLLIFVGRSHDGVALINRFSKLYPNTRVIIFNYRSYGKSGGRINENNIFSDALKITDLVKKNYGSLSVLGFSLGSSVAAYVASKRSIESLFLVGAFDSIALLTKSKYKSALFGLNLLHRYKFKTMDFVKSVHCDTYLFVSQDDEMTYIENARNLKKKIKNMKYYVELKDLSHKEILWDKEVVQKINEVLE